MKAAIFIVLIAATIAVGQRPSFAGTKPIGYPEITTEGLGDRFGEIDGTTQKLPLEANGDRDLVDRLSKLPIDKQPFWLINWQALEAHRQNPQTYPQKPNPFVDRPQNSANVIPASSNTGIPASSNTGIPASSNTGIPASSNTSIPASSNTGIPVSSNSGIPASSNTGIPVNSNTGITVSSNTGIPVSSNTGIPASSNTGIPTNSNTGIPFITNLNSQTFNTENRFGEDKKVPPISDSKFNSYYYNNNVGYFQSHLGHYLTEKRNSSSFGKIVNNRDSFRNKTPL